MSAMCGQSRKAYLQTWYLRNRDRALANVRAYQVRTSVRRVCAHCATEFSTKAPTQKYCSVKCNGDSLRLPDSKDRLRQRRAAASRKRALRAVSGRKVMGRWRRICERDGWNCWVCSLKIDPSLLPPHRLSGTADHVVPLSAGGSDADDNLRAAHFTCNSRRGAARFTPKVAA